MSTSPAIAQGAARTKAEVLQLLQENRERILSFGVTRLGLFGSLARDEARSESDVDILVDMEPITFRSYMGLVLFLEDLFGCKVDVALEDSLKPLLRPRVREEVVCVPGFAFFS